MARDANFNLGDVVTDLPRSFKSTSVDSDQLIELSHATRSQLKILTSFLELLIEKRGLRKHYRVDSNPHYTGLAQNLASPPQHDQEVDLREELTDYADLGFFRFEHGDIRVITSRGPVKAPMFKMTHINPKLLRDTLQEELLNESEEAMDTHDPRAYILLPQIIKNHLHRFNSGLRQHIIRCMASHLNTSEDRWAFQPKPNLNMHFSHNHHCDFPAIYVNIDNGAAVDLMELLATDMSKFTRADLKRIQPANTPEENLSLRASRKIHDTESHYQTSRFGLRTSDSG